MCPDEIRSNMYYSEKCILDGEVPNCFTAFFEEKVEKIFKSAIIDPTVYNGKTKLVAADRDFMMENDINFIIP